MIRCRKYAFCSKKRIFLSYGLVYGIIALNFKAVIYPTGDIK